MFPTSEGRWQSIRNWRKRGFSRACEEAGLVTKAKEDGKIVLKPKYRPYDLRDFYASMLIDQRVYLKRIQTLMGHRNIETTLNVYGHLIERAEAAAQPRTSVLTKRPFGAVFATKNQSSETRRNPPLSESVRFGLWVQRNLREEFLEVCRTQDKSAAQVLREFMREYIVDHNSRLGGAKHLGRAKKSLANKRNPA